MDLGEPEGFIRDESGGFKKCGTCAAGTYAAGGCEGGSDTTCEDFKTCGDGHFAEFTGNATHDVVCSPCSHCMGRRHKTGGCDGAVDTTCSTEDWENECEEGRFEKEPGSHLSAPVCERCRTCPEGMFKAGGCQGGMDTVCRRMRTCDEDSEWEVSPRGTDPQRLQNRVCARCDECGEGLFHVEGAGCNGFNNTVCQPMEACIPGLQYISVQGTPVSDRTCKVCRASCPAGKFEYGCDGRVDRQCVDIFQCVSSKYRFRQSTAKDGLSNTVCGECPKSSLKSYSIHFANNYDYVVALKNVETGKINEPPADPDRQLFADAFQQVVNGVFVEMDSSCPSVMQKPGATRHGQIVMGMQMSGNSLDFDHIDEKMANGKLEWAYQRTGYGGRRIVTMVAVPGSLFLTVGQLKMDFFADVLDESGLSYGPVREAETAFVHELDLKIGAGGDSERSRRRMGPPGGSAASHIDDCTRVYTEAYLRARSKGLTFSEATANATRASLPVCYFCTLESGKEECRTVAEEGLRLAKLNARDRFNEVIAGDVDGWMRCRELAEVFLNQLSIVCPAEPEVIPTRPVSTTQSPSPTALPTAPPRIGARKSSESAYDDDDESLGVVVGVSVGAAILLGLIVYFVHLRMSHAKDVKERRQVLRNQTVSMNPMYNNPGVENENFAYDDPTFYLPAEAVNAEDLDDITWADVGEAGVVEDAYASGELRDTLHRKKRNSWTDSWQSGADEFETEFTGTLGRMAAEGDFETSTAEEIHLTQQRQKKKPVSFAAQATLQRPTSGSSLTLEGYPDDGRYNSTTTMARSKEEPDNTRTMFRMPAKSVAFEAATMKRGGPRRGISFEERTESATTMARPKPTSSSVSFAGEQGSSSTTTMFRPSAKPGAKSISFALSEERAESATTMARPKPSEQGSSSTATMFRPSAKTGTKSISFALSEERAESATTMARPKPAKSAISFALAEEEQNASSTTTMARPRAEPDNMKTLFREPAKPASSSISFALSERHEEEEEKEEVVGLGDDEALSAISPDSYFVEEHLRDEEIGFGDHEEDEEDEAMQSVLQSMLMDDDILQQMQMDLMEGTGTSADFRF
jgi:hypothetical protein